jgi:hypothetical protein
MKKSIKSITFLSPLLTSVAPLIATRITAITPVISPALTASTPFIATVITTIFSALIALLPIFTRWLTNRLILTNRLTLLAMLYRIGHTTIEVTVSDATGHRNTGNR